MILTGGASSYVRKTWRVMGSYGGGTELPSRNPEKSTLIVYAITAACVPLTFSENNIATPSATAQNYGMA